MKTKDLYGLPLEDFIGARNALVRDLKKRGESDQAEIVRQLRKPSIPVWAINQLARTQGKKIRKLVQDADALRRAHGGSEDRFREALAAERRTGAELVEDAGRILGESGHSASQDTLDRISATLQAAAADPARRKELTEGRLTDELEPLGFEALAGVKLAPRQSGPGRRTSSRSAKQSSDEAKAAAATARTEARHLEQEAQRAERAARQARARADKARAESERLAERLRDRG